jgi:hypothetical protein
VLQDVALAEQASSVTTQVGTGTMFEHPVPKLMVSVVSMVWNPLLP